MGLLISIFHFFDAENKIHETKNKKDDMIIACLAFNISSSLRKQPTFGDATTGFPPNDD